MRFKYCMILLIIIIFVNDIVLSARYKRPPKQSRRQRRPRRDQITQNYDELVRYFPGDQISGLSKLVTWNPKKQRFTPILNTNGKTTKRFQQGIYVEYFRRDRITGMTQPIPRYIAVHKAKQN
jgi:hypothetical protein